MITVEVYEVFVALVGVMKVLRMVRFNEVVTSGRCKQSWYKTIFDMLYWLQLINIKISFFLDSRGHKF